MYGPDLFNATEPPEVWIHFHPPAEGATDDHRMIDVRIKPHLAPSMTVALMVGRYSPEWQILRAISEAFNQLACLQAAPSLVDLHNILLEAISLGVDPF